MMMGPRLRKLALTAHVACSVGSVGAVAACLVLAATGLTSQDSRTVRAAYLAMDLTTRLVIGPVLLASLLAGVIQSLGTTWGLFRHHWVVAKLLLTLLVLVVLSLQLDLIAYLADMATQNMLSSADRRGLRSSPVIHAAGGLVALLVPVALSVYKPRGMTRYGWRKHHEQPRTSLRSPETGS